MSLTGSRPIWGSDVETDASSDGVRIVDVEVGIVHAYKTGYWTPTGYPFYWLINLDKNPNGHGTHWTVMWTPNNRQFFYMDSYGLPPDPAALAYAKRQGAGPGDFVRLSQRIQYKKSTTCGWFVLSAIFTAGTTRASYTHWESQWDLRNHLANETRLRKWALQILSPSSF